MHWCDRTSLGVILILREDFAVYSALILWLEYICKESFVGNMTQKRSCWLVGALRSWLGHQGSALANKLMPFCLSHRTGFRFQEKGWLHFLFAPTPGPAPNMFPLCLPLWNNAARRQMPGWVAAPLPLSVSWTIRNKRSFFYITQDRPLPCSQGNKDSDTFFIT